MSLLCRIQEKAEEKQAIVGQIRAQQIASEEAASFRNMQGLFMMKMMQQLMEPQTPPVPTPPSTQDQINDLNKKLDVILQHISKLLAQRLCRFPVITTVHPRAGRGFESSESTIN